VLVFVGFGVNAHFIEQTGQLGIVALIFLAAGVFVLPRHTRKGHVAGTEGLSQEHLERIGRLGSLATTLRMVYLGVALVVLFVLPAIVPPPS